MTVFLGITCSLLSQFRHPSRIALKFRNPLAPKLIYQRFASIMSKTPVSTLQEFSVKKMWGVPEYLLISNAAVHGPTNFTFKVSLSGYPSGISACGTASNKKDAKHEAAKALLKLLDLGKNHIANVAQQPKQSKDLEQEIGSYYLSSFKETSHTGIFINSVGKLSEYCIEWKLKLPEYRDGGVSGPPHKRVYTIVCCIGDIEIKASANTKKKAKHDAAQEMLDKLVRNVNKEKSQLMNEQYQAIEKNIRGMSFLDFKIDEPSISVKDSAVKANRLYTKLKTYRNIKKDIKRIDLNESHLIFRDSYESCVRETVLERLSLSNPYPKMSKQETLKTVTSLLGLEVEYNVISNTPDPVIVVGKLSSTPIIVEMGLADSYLEARDQLIENLLNSINILLT
ncbi:uncharacterized protein [Venturia canescens]|uniref:uncharacterized protein isoform X2 n=1 Tax=Venturia canescens TaxID=32260 RepID=UPI001C9CA0AF|nr:uncharacterized protein LOC122416639 isoform X2 [Venturia canescens]